MNTLDKIQIMQAFEDGKEIECLAMGEGLWFPSSTPLWQWQDFAYRIKEETKTLDKVLIQENLALAILNIQKAHKELEK